MEIGVRTFICSSSSKTSAPGRLKSHVNDLRPWIIECLHFTYTRSKNITESEAYKIIVELRNIPAGHDTFDRPSGGIFCRSEMI